MKRLGVAASKMSKGNIVWYNIYVILLSVLFGVFVFVIAGSVTVLGLIIIGNITSHQNILQYGRLAPAICMGTLIFGSGLLAFLLIIINLKLSKDKFSKQ